MDAMDEEVLFVGTASRTYRNVLKTIWHIRKKAMMLKLAQLQKD